MFRLICSALMLGGVCVLFAWYPVLSNMPVINKGDYGAILNYLQKYIPEPANTAFRADALSQLLSATGVLRLVDQRRLSLDQPVHAVLPEFSVRSRFHTRWSDADQDITVRRLVSPQSGLPSEHLRGLHG